MPISTNVILDRMESFPVFFVIRISIWVGSIVAGWVALGRACLRALLKVLYRISENL